MLGAFIPLMPVMPGLLKSFIFFMTNFLAVLSFGFGLCLTGRAKHLPTPRKSYVSELEVQLGANRRENQECKRLNRVYIDRIAKLKEEVKKKADEIVPLTGCSIYFQAAYKTAAAWKPQYEQTKSQLDQADLEKTKLESEKDEAQRLYESTKDDLNKLKRQVEKLNSENAHLRAQDTPLNASEVAGALVFFEDSDDDSSDRDCRSSHTVGLKKPLQPQKLQFGSTSRQQDVVGRDIHCEKFEMQHSRNAAKTTKEPQLKASQLQKSCDNQQARIQELEQDKKCLQTRLNQYQIAKKKAEAEKDEAVKAYNNVVEEKRDVEKTLQKVRESLHKKDEKERENRECITRLGKDKEGLEGERDAWKVQIEKLDNERQEAASAKDNAEKMTAKLESELQTTKESLIQSDVHVEEGDKLLKEANQTITNLQSQIPAPDQQIQSQEAVNRLMQDARQDVRKQLNEHQISPRDETIKNLKDYVIRLENAIRTAMGNLRLQAQEVRELEDLGPATSRLWKKITGVSAENTTMTTNMQQLQQAMNDRLGLGLRFPTTFKDILDVLVDRKKKSDSMTEEIKWLQEQCTRHQSSPGASLETNEWKPKYDKMREEFIKLAEERDGLKRKHIDAQSKKESLEKEKETLLRERWTSRTLNSTYQSQIQDLKKEIAELDSQKTTLQDNCDELKGNAEELSKEKTQLESQKIKLTSEVTNLAAQKGRLWNTFVANQQGRMGNHGPAKREWTEDNNSNQEPGNEASTEVPKVEGTGKDGSNKVEGLGEERTIKKKRTDIS
ncbi:MAG: hypothetical protein Q9212_002729 [Teloschistes hypoglaucus]